MKYGLLHEVCKTLWSYVYSEVKEDANGFHLEC